MEANGQNVLEGMEVASVEEAPEGYTLFWRAQSPFSQWHTAPFVDEQGVQYNCAEQYMMYQKAVYFGDMEVARRILREQQPQVQKRIAKDVRNFDETEWNKVSRDYVKKGSWLKYSQNPNLRRELFATAYTVLVEASHDDFRWGIGSVKDDPMSWRRQTWRGENWLGNILTEVRDELMAEMGPDLGALSPRSHPGISYRAFSLPQSPFHLFHPCEMKDKHGWVFSCAGVYLLFRKARFLKEREVMRNIAESGIPADRLDLVEAFEQKLVHASDDLRSKWLTVETQFRHLHKVNSLKLKNSAICQKLLLTGSDYLVYAAEEPPLGTDYAARRNAGDRVEDNFLGRSLMQIRDKSKKFRKYKERQELKCSNGNASFNCRDS